MEIGIFTDDRCWEKGYNKSRPPKVPCKSRLRNIYAMKKIYLGVGLLVLLFIGYAIPKFLINEPFGGRDITSGTRLESNGQRRTVYFCGGSEQDPDVLAVGHLSTIQKLLTIKFIFSNEDLVRDKNIYKAYTWFGIPVATIELDCKTGTFQTTSGL
ncbi:MAG: hypothetical protein KGJ93_04290 [Patescibacteria group bacterium]|nr:hypothetical protein [Patescibacteria group bacterium]